MKIEKGKDKIIFLSGFILAVVLIILINIFITKASYRKTESIPLAKGTINYSLADLNIIAMYKEKDEYLSDDDKYESINIMPSKGYAINTEKSYCYITNKEEHDLNARLYTNNKGEHVIANITKGSKCYLYFDKKITSEDTLAKLGLSDSVKGEVEKFTGPSCGNCTVRENGIYKTEDNDGTSYYYRGTVDYNWVKFGTTDSEVPVWWRIVRINGDGTIRLIYAGTGVSAPSQTDTNSVVAKNQYYSISGNYNDNTYVGFYTGSTGVTNFAATHSNTTASNVAAQLKTWYEGTGWKADEFEQYIDTDAGFCNDRTIHPTAKTWYASEGSLNRGTGTVVTAYGPYSRTLTSGTSANYNTTQTPTLICGKKPDGTGQEVDQTAYERDLFTPSEAKKGNGALDVPVGLITADEVIFAGGFGGQGNNGYYLYNNQSFWTMSPNSMSGRGPALVFVVNDKGLMGSADVNATNSVRPVINLKADVEISGHGLYNDPYVIETE